MVAAVLRVATASDSKLVVDPALGRSFGVGHSVAPLELDGGRFAAAFASDHRRQDEVRGQKVRDAVAPGGVHIGADRFGEREQIADTFGLVFPFVQLRR
jgi:hypothetical protein